MVDTGEILRTLFSGAICTTLLISAVPLLTGLLVGLVVSIFQAATQIQEQTLSFVFKALSIGAALYYSGAWLAAELLAFAEQSLLSVPALS